MTVKEASGRAKAAQAKFSAMQAEEKSKALRKIADAIERDCDTILQRNAIDVENARNANMKESLIDRLLLTKERISAIADAVRKIADLPDPIGEGEMSSRPNGLKIIKKRVPIGVIGVIYEARPNVTADVSAICIKTGNAVVLKGGSDAINSNKAIVSSIKTALKDEKICEDVVTLIESTDRESVKELITQRELIDLVIPRGGAGLIKYVVNNATVPVIETGTGNCHIYVDEYADTDMAVKILLNAKTQRTGVCNAAESLLVHRKIADKFLPKAVRALEDKGVSIYGCEKTALYGENIIPAEEEDYSAEYLDLKISCKIVNSIDEAINHINKYSTGHSEAIITENYKNAEVFTELVDSAAVYVNASTRFTDGGEFGFGAEIGISTQKIHARGPMGLKEMTTYKYIVLGNGEIR